MSNSKDSEADAKVFPLSALSDWISEIQTQVERLNFP